MSPASTAGVATIAFAAPDADSTVRPAVSRASSALREMDGTSDCNRVEVSFIEPPLTEAEATALADAVAASAHVREVYLRQCLGRTLNDDEMSSLTHDRDELGDSQTAESGHDDDEWRVRFYAKLFAPHPSLKAIYLGANDLSMSAVRCIASSLGGFSSAVEGPAAGISVLKKLWLMDDNIDDDDDAVEVLMDALRFNHGEIEELDLYTDSIAVRGCRAIAAFLGSPSCRLKFLDLGENGLGDDEAEALAEGLETNASLKALRLDGNMGITDRGAGAFERAYQRRQRQSGGGGSGSCWKVDLGPSSTLCDHSSRLSEANYRFSEKYGDWLMTADDNAITKGYGHCPL